MNILVALDGSPASTAALKHAISLATATEGELILAHAVDPDVYEATNGGGVRAGDIEDQLLVEAVETAEADGEDVLEDAAVRADDAGVPYERFLVYGSPVETLANTARERGVDGIVVGHRSLSERHEQLLGSVAKGLIERSAIPVTVVQEHD